ncbi:MAG: hypothetical protein KC464_26735, partial [Myxococcales bacterium]|nr:hypothetical protein [Myxococcales bacterium]
MLARVFASRWCVPLAVLVAAILSASCERRSGIPVGDPGAEDQRAEPTGPDADYLALGEIRRCSALPHRGQPEFARLFDPPRPWLGDHEDPLDAVVEGFRRLSALATAVDAYGRCKATGETYDVMVMMLEVAATVAPSWHRYVTGLTRDDPDRVASEAEAEQLVDGIAAIVSSLPFMAKDPHVYMAMPSEPLVRRLGVALREPSRSAWARPSPRSVAQPGASEIRSHASTSSTWSRSSTGLRTPLLLPIPRPARRRRDAAPRYGPNVGTGSVTSGSVPWRVARVTTMRWLRSSTSWRNVIRHSQVPAPAGAGPSWTVSSTRS